MVACVGTCGQDGVAHLVMPAGTDHPSDPVTYPVRAPLTLDQLIEQLSLLRARHPEHATRPVHLLNTDNDGDGLVTDVDVDCFDSSQGLVTSLLSSPMF